MKLFWSNCQVSHKNTEASATRALLPSVCVCVCVCACACKCWRFALCRSMYCDVHYISEWASITWSFTTAAM